MVYITNEPIATDKLSTSQPKLRDNTNASDTSFGQDHYAFSDLTGNNGLHKKVTTIVQASVPTTTTNPILYSYQQYAIVGPLQYSKGMTDAVPSPVTFLQSPATPISILSGGTSPILDFNTISFAMAYLSVYGVRTGPIYVGLYAQVIWHGSFKLSSILGSAGLSITSSGTQLILGASQNITDIRWVLEFKRIE